VGIDEVKPVIVGWLVAEAKLEGFGVGAKSAGVGTCDTKVEEVGFEVASEFLVGLEVGR